MVVFVMFFQPLFPDNRNFDLFASKQVPYDARVSTEGKSVFSVNNILFHIFVDEWIGSDAAHAKFSAGNRMRTVAKKLNLKF
jgi:hypothetical protein